MFNTDEVKYWDFLVQQCLSLEVTKFGNQLWPYTTQNPSDIVLKYRMDLPSFFRLSRCMIVVLSLYLPDNISPQFSLCDSRLNFNFSHSCSFDLVLPSSDFLQSSPKAAQNFLSLSSLFLFASYFAIWFFLFSACNPQNSFVVHQAFSISA